MKISLFILLIIIAQQQLCAQADTLYKFYDPDSTKWFGASGYVNKEGEVVIPLGKYQFCHTDKFHKIAFVSFYDTTGIYAINRAEKILFEVFNCDSGPDYVCEGLFRIKKDGKIGFANLNGDIVIPPRFEQVWPFKEDRARYCKGGHTEKYLRGEIDLIVGAKWGFIDKNGKEVIPAQYDGLSNFYNGKAAAKKDNKWGIIDKFGNILTEFIYDRYEDIPDDKFKL